LWHPPVAAGGEAPTGFWPLLAYSLTSPAFWYLAMMMTGLFSIGYAAFSITHAAMGYEMSTDYNERTHLFKWRLSACALAGFITPWLMPFAMWLEGDRSQQLRGLARGGAGQYRDWDSDSAGRPAVGSVCREKVAEHKYEEKVPFLTAIR